MKRGLRRFLRRRGATDAEIENATRSGYLALLVLDREIMPGPRVYTSAQLAQRAGTDIETARAIWRAIGFPDLPDDLPAFTERDADALRSLAERIESPWFVDWSLERAVPLARVLNASFARIADAETDDLARSFGMAYEAGLGDEELAELLAERFDFGDISRLLDHTHRLQLRAAVWRRLAASDPSQPGTITAAVGFVDLVGYTALAQMLDDDELGALVKRFGDVTHDTIVTSGGRIVKTIGDEVMFVTDTAATAAEIALGLVELTEVDDVLPTVRAGLAFGPLLAREGDYFGPMVNLSSRLTEVARPGSVLASEGFGTALEDNDRFRVRRIPSRRIRDIGRVEVYRIERGEAAG
jgi:adenylate cyclase